MILHRTAEIDFKQIYVLVLTGLNSYSFVNNTHLLHTRTRIVYDIRFWRIGIKNKIDPFLIKEDNIKWAQLVEIHSKSCFEHVIVYVISTYCKHCNSNINPFILITI